MTVGLAAAAALAGPAAQLGSVVSASAGDVVRARHSVVLETTVVAHNLVAKVPGGVKKPGTP